MKTKPIPPTWEFSPDFSREVTMLLSARRKYLGMRAHGGEPVYFRLYAHGYVDFHVWNGVSVVDDYATRSVRLDFRAFAKTLTALEQLESLRLEPEYKLMPGCDSAYFIEITIGDRTIIICNYHPEVMERYPPKIPLPAPLVYLLDFMEGVREGTIPCLTPPPA